MCGLIALFDKSNNNVDARTIESRLLTCNQMLDTLRFRGPDESSLMHDKSVILGHTRLSIIDIATGSQPIYNEDKTISVILNGEIYNYHRLRRELELRGHQFRTTSDTEVIVHLYEECAEDVFSKLNGMFAIVIYDNRTNTFIAARDRAGEKPLVYWESPELFIVASEIKALLQYPAVSREIDGNALALYLNSMYVPSPMSIFVGIRKLPPAHFIRISGGKTSILKYWEPCQTIRWGWREDDIREQFLETFADAVKIRTYSDVPLGVFLSGGIDSSAVAAFMARDSSSPIRTFTVGFTQEIDERPFARLVAERYQTAHTEILISDRIDDVVEDVLGYFDEPFGDSSAIPTYLISREAREHVKVILTGDGGDELFAGYGSYLDQKYQTRSRVLTKLYKSVNQFSKGYWGSGLLESLYPRSTNSLRAFKHWHWVRTIYTDQELREILPAQSVCSQDFFRNSRWLELNGADALTASYSFDMNFYLPDDLLKKVDMASMLSSLECRAPFLDHRLIELSFQMPPNLKVKNDCLKYLLKKSMADFLPPEILHRRKTGFGAPVESWLKSHLKTLTLDLLHRGCKIESYVEPKAIQRIVNAFYQSDSHHDYRVAYKLWLLFVLELWMRKYL
ncbi:asparagine synthase (glutamine-hydrolyzing) [Geobacter anodireducens]|uniref:asparagine synthase (glutamine-hydrolyzing) n=1 Tax=Geobacter anodireducens TaxID=1340425 RepID=A0ABR9NR58_9BACT|nr:asparagine synthase (glutamine-hydrolyzing) [Geobacter anodireducens]MBE2886748.1 asparagine synthase (glutamine-hydrolyzing) [Geobacter anodireducens]